MLTVKNFFFALILMAILWVGSSYSKLFAANNPLITNYHSIFAFGYNKHSSLRIAIRMYHLGKKPYLLLVNPYNFATEIVPFSSISLKNIPQVNGLNYYNHYLPLEIKNTPYVKALIRYTSPPYPLQNYGITHTDHLLEGVFLTVDMCPSKKSFEKTFFQRLVIQTKQTGQVVPLGIGLSGSWAIHHQKEFAWLLQQQKLNTLQITWIDHSFHHLYYVQVPLRENFLLTPSTNITHEILDTEKLLITHGQTPSVFFRFPGLVSSKCLVLKLRQFGLIPIASNAWLAKGQSPKQGSIILVHGNGNEPKGIKLFFKMQEKNKFHLLPLSHAF